MPRVTHVKKAQQRYKTVPVMGEDGQPKKTPVMRNGVQKTTKRGVPVFMKVTKADKSQPLPELDCDYPGCDINGGKIAVGTPYKHITPKSGPYGGYQRNRHAEHPNWAPWEYSSSLSARVAQVQSEAGDLISSYEFSAPEDFDDLKQQVVDMASELRDEKEEAVNNMPEGLAEGSQAQEQYEALEQWVDEIDGCDAPDHDDTCGDCEGSGTVDCEDCGGTGHVEEDEDSGRWFVVNADGSGDVFEDQTEGFETEEDAQRQLDELLKVTGEAADAFTILIRTPDEECETCEGEGTIDCEQCGGEGTIDDEVSEDWAEEAKQVIQDALDNCEA